MDTPTAGTTQPTDDQATELPPLPAIADLVSREIRRMGRAWKIEAVKSALHVAINMMVMSVLGAGWMIVLTVIGVLGWLLWSKFSLKATIKPYNLGRRKTNTSAALEGTVDVGEQYSSWLTGSDAAAGADLDDIRDG